MKILTAKEGYTIQQVLDAINQLAVAYWQDQGFTVDQDGLVGKKEGVDNHDAQKTVTWAEIQYAPDDTPYIHSLSNDDRFSNWKSVWIDAGLPDMYNEIDMPPEWNSEEV